MSGGNEYLSLFPSFISVASRMVSKTLAYIWKVIFLFSIFSSSLSRRFHDEVSVFVSQMRYARLVLHLYLVSV